MPASSCAPAPGAGGPCALWRVTAASSAPTAACRVRQSSSTDDVAPSRRTGREGEEYDRGAPANTPGPLLTLSMHRWLYSAIAGTLNRAVVKEVRHGFTRYSRIHRDSSAAVQKRTKRDPCSQTSRRRLLLRQTRLCAPLKEERTPTPRVSRRPAVLFRPGQRKRRRPRAPRCAGPPSGGLRDLSAGLPAEASSSRSVGRAL